MVLIPSSTASTTSANEDSFSIAFLISESFIMIFWRSAPLSSYIIGRTSCSHFDRFCSSDFKSDSTFWRSEVSLFERDSSSERFIHIVRSFCSRFRCFICSLSRTDATFWLSRCNSLTMLSDVELKIEESDSSSSCNCRSSEI